MSNSSVFTRRAVARGVTTYTPAHSYLKVRAVDSVQSGSFEARPAQALLPFGRDGVVDVASGGVSSNALVLKLFGTGADGATMKAKVVGWSQAGDGLWLPADLVAVDATLSTFVGLAGTYASNLHRFADTLAITLGTDGVDLTITSPANNTPAMAIVDLKGCQFVEVLFDRNASATACNGLYRPL